MRMQAAESAMAASLTPVTAQAAAAMEAPVGRAAAMTVTFQVVQLLGYGSLVSRISLPTLRDMSQAARLASDSTVGWHLLALAEILRHCKQDKIRVC